MIWSILLGLVLGGGLNGVLARQMRALPGATSLARRYRLPGVGSLSQPVLLACVVMALTPAITASLWQRYDWTFSFWLLLAASLVLIDTAVIDWRFRMIDTLLLTAAILITVILAPWIIGSWFASLLGLLGAGFAFLIIFMCAKLLYPGHQAPFGLGDIYLGMFIGALLGVVHVGAALLYGMLLAGAASVGLILMLGYGRARFIPIAYGSFLCLGALLYLALWPL